MFEVMDELRPDPTPTNMHQPDIVGDVSPIEPCDIWKIKGPPAPSAIDMHRRLEVLDTMGIDRQLVSPDDRDRRDDGGRHERHGLRHAIRRRRLDARRHVEAGVHGQLPAGLQRVGHERARAGGRPDPDGRDRAHQREPERDDRDRAQADRFRGPAVYVQADNPGRPLAGPLRARPFWRMFEEADVPVTLHIGTEFAFLDPRWSMAETFMDLFQSPEIPNTTIHMFATVHMAVDNSCPPWFWAACSRGSPAAGGPAGGRCTLGRQRRSADGHA
ncbi:hypothetical protein HBB16_01815 [Pseudonocardia sp. MCCB 268]|nr:hypothetical protein [Pseudonocardia cytotoxica]